MKILVVLTGGTIGSKTEEEIIDVSPAAAYSLIQLYQKNHGEDVEFEVIQPLNILSENMTMSHWETLCNTLNRVRFENYDGIVITHGSDTISYTAAMIGYCYRHTPIPIVMIASNYNLMDTRSNGLSNFYNAVCFIRTKVANGVFVIFQNNKKENIVYLSTRLVEADTYLDQFSTYGGVDFGQMIDGCFVQNPHKQNPSLEELKQYKSKIVSLDYNFTKKILLIRPYPGLDYSHITLDEQVGGVLHCLYHSATACNDFGAYSAADFIRQCREKKIAVYASSFKQSVNHLYATSMEILKAGAIPLTNISTEAAYAKLVVAYNLLGDAPEEFMKENIYYEMLPSLSES